MRRLALLLTLCLGLAACGGDDEEPASKPATQAAPAATTTAKEESVPAGVTKPGTTLDAGETGRVLMTPLSPTFAETDERFPLDVTVSEIKRVKISDLEGVNLDAAQKKSTPYFAKLKITNPGPERVPVKDDDPDVRFNGIDDRGQEHNSVIFIGGFPACEDEDPPARFAKGQSYETCHVYLIPGGGTLDGVAWTSGMEYVDKPVTWK